MYRNGTNLNGIAKDQKRGRAMLEDTAQDVCELAGSVIRLPRPTCRHVSLEGK